MNGAGLAIAGPVFGFAVVCRQATKRRLCGSKKHAAAYMLFPVVSGVCRLPDGSLLSVKSIPSPRHKMFCEIDFF